MRTSNRNAKDASLVFCFPSSRLPYALDTPSIQEIIVSPKGLGGNSRTAGVFRPHYTTPLLSAISKTVNDVLPTSLQKHRLKDDPSGC